MNAPALKALATVERLTVRAATPRGTATILRGVSLEVPRGAILGVVGESGSGKSTLGAALMGMLPVGLHAEGRIGFGSQDLLALDRRAMARLRGVDLAMVAQDPMTALNPLFTRGRNSWTSPAAAIPPYPAWRHARQRRPCWAGWASPTRTRGWAPIRTNCLAGCGSAWRSRGLLAEPKLLVADEPTTALDATVEAQIAALFADLRQTLSGSIVFISHHLGLVAQLCDSVCVLYAGTVVETGPAEAVTRAPLHPYTQALLDCEIDPAATGPLRFIPGAAVPDPGGPVAGCIFASRCPRVEAALPRDRAALGGEGARPPRRLHHGARCLTHCSPRTPCASASAPWKWWPGCRSRWRRARCWGW